MRIVTLLIGLLLLAACSANGNAEPLSTEEIGVYHGLIVYSDDADGMENPEFLRDLDDVVKDRSEFQPEVAMMTETSAAEKYPDLDIPTTPYYVFYDKEGVGVATKDKEEAEAFLLEQAEEQGLLKKKTSMENVPEPPKLTVHVGDKDINPTLGSYSWRVDQEDGTASQIQADSLAPPELLKNKSPLKTSRDADIALKFEKQPDSYRVKIWNEENEVISTSDNVELSGEGETIYEVLADWKQGTASYSFTLDIE